MWNRSSSTPEAESQTSFGTARVGHPATKLLKSFLEKKDTDHAGESDADEDGRLAAGGLMCPVSGQGLANVESMVWVPLQVIQVPQTNLKNHDLS